MHRDWRHGPYVQPFRDTDPQYIPKGARCLIPPWCASDDRVKPLQLQRGLRPRPRTHNCIWFPAARLHHGPRFGAPARKLLNEDASPNIDLAGGHVAVIRCRDLHVVGAAEKLAVHPVHQTTETRSAAEVHSARAADSRGFSATPLLHVTCADIRFLHLLHLLHADTTRLYSLGASSRLKRGDTGGREPRHEYSLLAPPRPPT